MDGTTLHLLTRLDAIRETQLRHGQVIEMIAAALSARRADSSPPKMSSASFLPIAASAAQWIGGIGALVYLARGGDIGTAMAFLQKLF
jgi:hypothetical protein